MRASAKIFWILGVFFLIVAIAYGLVTHRYEPHGIETVGFPAFLALSGLGVRTGMPLTSSARRQALDASGGLAGAASEAAGVQGSFSPYSWAPLWASLGAALVFVGVAAGWWLFAFGVIFALYGVLRWVLESSSG